MTIEKRKKLEQALKEEEMLKDALEFNYYNKEKRTRAYFALKKVQLFILKLYLEDKNEQR